MNCDNFSVALRIGRVLDFIMNCLFPQFTRGVPGRPKRIFLLEDPGKTVSPLTHQWATGSPPARILQIAEHLARLHADPTLISSGRTRYDQPITYPGDARLPSPADIAAFIFENCHNDLLLETALTALAFCGLNLYRDNECLDLPSFLFFRYPHPVYGRALTLTGDPGSTFATLLNRFGLSVTSDNLIDHYKLDIKQLLQKMIGLMMPLYPNPPGAGDWARDVLPRPAFASYGRSIIPKPPFPNCWSLQPHDSSCVQQACIDAQGPSINADLAISHIKTRFDRPPPYESRSTDSQLLQLAFAETEFATLMDWVHATYVPHIIVGAPPTITVTAAGLTLSLHVTHALATRGLLYDECMPTIHNDRGRNTGNGAKRTLPSLCTATEKLRSTLPFAAIVADEKSPRVNLAFPSATN